MKTIYHCGCCGEVFTEAGMDCDCPHCGSHDISSRGRYKTPEPFNRDLLLVLDKYTCAEDPNG